MLETWGEAGLKTQSNLNSKTLSILEMIKILSVRTSNP